MHQDIAVLFRYRDLIARTISEHQQTIADSKVGCFWGWWKRPTEGTRNDDVWDFLERQLARGGEYAIGLFDSGEGDARKAVRRAWITEIRKPPSGAGTHWEPVGLAEDERELVPTYYRSSPFSRAWLKIVRIEEPIDFFGKYSYDETPRLPGMQQGDLEKFRGKVVIDPDELRAMDTTVWRVRAKQASDPIDRVLASSTRVVAPVSSAPVPVSGKVILHLSDLHFAVGERRHAQHRWKYPGDSGNVATLADAVSDSVPANDVAALLITGDFTFLADPEEFALAQHAVNTMIGRFNLSTDQIVIVPGNHDIKWTKDPAEKHGYDRPTSVATPDARKAYEAFYRNLLRQEPHEHLAMGRRYIFQNGVVVDIAALNSTALETGKQYLAGMGRVGVGAFRKVRREMGWETDGNLNPAIALRVLALHHHLVGAEDVENPGEYYTGFGTAIDARVLAPTLFHRLATRLYREPPALKSLIGRTSS